MNRGIRAIPYFLWKPESSAKQNPGPLWFGMNEQSRPSSYSSWLDSGVCWNGVSVIEGVFTLKIDPRSSGVGVGLNGLQVGSETILMTPVAE